MDLGIGADGVDGATLPSKRRVCVFQRGVGQRRIEPPQRRFEPVWQDRVTLRCTALRARAVGELAEQIAGRPAEFGEQIDRRLFDEIVLGETAEKRWGLRVSEVVGVRSHGPVGIPRSLRGASATKQSRDRRAAAVIAGLLRSARNDGKGRRRRVTLPPPVG
jgi:hypothetical protein